MFGGHGLYADGLFFGIVDDDVLYLRVDAESRAAFEAHDAVPFEYATRDGKHQAMSYLRARPTRRSSGPTRWGCG
jgi:DNA transformation protein